MTTMKALIYSSTGQVSLVDYPKPTLRSPTDAIIRVTQTTICGSDLHILKGDVASCTPSRILGHEGVGVVDSVGSSVRSFRAGDRVLISCITQCATCTFCRRGMPSHCTSGGWMLGNQIDGTQAEFVRIPHAESSLFAIPESAATREGEAALVMLSDIFPTALECGVLNGKVSPGSTVAVVGAGPVGLAAVVTAQLYTPAVIIVVDVDDNRLSVAKSLGAQYTVNSKTHPDVAERVKALTEGGLGCNAVIEAVGIPATFELGQRILAPGGVLANVGVHGTKVDLFLEDLWSKNISITTKLVDTVSTPMLLRLVASGRLEPAKMITHRFKFSQMEEAYKTFGEAAKHNALKVLIEM
ncbi:chaperonin 10-like protein [Podospora didyma]|uniref:Chaperonin 10-like protein n=1 Tax=Podospora didyma TaxID=330526 RepID=A0AAE0NG05_9PEZI|nr:chaperonin 10-like protein [Podospora didyma]